MSEVSPARLAHARKHRMRANAHLAIRHDAWRFMPPGSPLYVGKDVVRYFWGDPAASEPSADSEDKAERMIAAELEWLRGLKREAEAIKADLQILRRLRERKYSADQPRVPAGSREGGQWAGAGGHASGRAQYAALKRPGDRDDTPSNPPPEIPQARPPTIQERNLVAKLLARSSITMEALAAGPKWLYDHLATMQAYRDPPKALEDLQDAVTDRTTPGYQDHHIVGQVARREEGRNFPESRIDSSENIVRIPTLKHEDINGWYGRTNDDPKFGGLSPREYLRGKTWSERYEVGLDALILHKVLKP